MQRVPARLWTTSVVAGWLAVAAIVGLQLSRPHSGVDMHTYWTAAQDMAHGLSPYTDARFVYPPFAAVLLSPFGHIDWPAARVVGSLFAGLAIVLTILLSARALRIPLRNGRLVVVAAVVVAGHLFAASAALGNISALVAVLLAAVYLAVAQEHDVVAGVVLGASLAIKPMLLPVLVIFVLWARWRPLIASAVSATACTAVAALVVPNSGWFVTRALPDLWRAHPASFDPLNSTLSSVGHLAGVPTVVVAVVRIAVVLLALAVAVTVRIRRPRLEAAAAISAGSALLLAQFCAGGLTEDHFLLTLVPLLVTLAGVQNVVWPPVAWPALVAVSGAVHAPASWYGGGQRAQWAADTTLRLLGQLGLLVALLRWPLGYGHTAWNRTRSARTSSRSSPLRPGSASGSPFAGCSPGSGVGPAQPPGPGMS